MVASIINKNEKMKKVIVFGATGNLGAYITIYLKSVGYDVIAVGHRKDDNGFFASRGMKYYSVDITKPEEFEQLPTENIYCVAHFAGELPSRYSFHASDLVQSITIGTLNVLEYMRSCGCKKIVFPQTPSDMCQYHNNGSVIPVDAPRHFPLTGDHSIYTIANIIPTLTIIVISSFILCHIVCLWTGLPRVFPLKYGETVKKPKRWFISKILCV